MSGNAGASALFHISKCFLETKQNTPTNKVAVSDLKYYDKFEAEAEYQYTSSDQCVISSLLTVVELFSPANPPTSRL